MIAAASKVGRHGRRARALILLMFRHGLRVSEASSLRWQEIDFKQGEIHIHRRKNGKPSVQPLYGDEIRALRQLRRDYPDTPYVIVSERRTPLSERVIHQIVVQSRGESWVRIPHASPHVAARLRVLPRRQGSRYPHDSGLPRTSPNPAPCSLHGASAGTL